MTTARLPLACNADTDEHTDDILRLDDYRSSSSTAGQEPVAPLEALGVAQGATLYMQRVFSDAVLSQQRIVWQMQQQFGEVTKTLIESASYPLFPSVTSTVGSYLQGAYRRTPASSSIERPAREDTEKRFAERVVGSLREAPVEDGYSHPVEQIIKDALIEFPAAAPQWVQSIYIENIVTSPDISIGVLRCVGRLPYELIAPWGMVLAAGALSHQDIEVLEAAVRAFERWGGRGSIEILKSRVAAEPVPWMADYLGQVLLDLSS